jgi:orotate phosphoribosyltransferase
MAERHDNSSTPLDGLAIRDGHFLLESGLHAASWIDLDTLFLDSRALAPHIAALAALISRHQVSAVCGPLLGGAFVAQAIAIQLGVRFYFAERVSSAPNEGLFQAVYRLPNSQRVRAATERFAVVDDVIGAGSAVRATVGELASLGATTAVVGALLTLGSRAGSHLQQVGIPVVTLGSREIAMWEPQVCPRCQAGIPLQSPS